MRFNDERAPLEMGTGSKKMQVLVCPHCRYSRTTSINTVAVTCGNCKKYFSASDSLKPEDAVGTLDTYISPNQVRVKLKEKMEKEAYEWRDAQQAKGNLGVKSHEPDGKSRNT